MDVKDERICLTRITEQDARSLHITEQDARSLHITEQDARSLHITIVDVTTAYNDLTRTPNDYVTSESN
jgi:hypothetical protein